MMYGADSHMLATRERFGLQPRSQSAGSERMWILTTRMLGPEGISIQRVIVTGRDVRCRNRGAGNDDNELRNPRVGGEQWHKEVKHKELWSVWKRECRREERNRWNLRPTPGFQKLICPSVSLAQAERRSRDNRLRFPVLRYTEWGRMKEMNGKSRLRQEPRRRQIRKTM